MTDKGARAVQHFGMDFLPVILLFAISITGLALTVSQEWLRGGAYSFLAILHAVTVIAALLFLPFGKFFHIFQRPAQLGVKLYQDAGDDDPGAICTRCGERFASRMHIDDLNAVLPQLGFDYSLASASSPQPLPHGRGSACADALRTNAPCANDAPNRAATVRERLLQPMRDTSTWQDLCPACKRKSLALAQLRIKEAARG
jgi:hypothetical protein